MTTLQTMYEGQANSPATTLTGSIMASSTTINVLDASVLPSEVPFLLTLGFDQPISETVLVTNSSENVLTVTRGVDGVATEWPSDTRCARTFTSLDLNTVQENITALNNGKQEEITASGLLKGSGDGNISAAQAGTDYQTPLTAGTDYATPTQLAGKQDEITASGLLKGDGSGNISAAVAGVDYLPMSGGTLTGSLVLSGEPTVENGAATKGYIDNLVGDINSALDTINGEVV